MSEPREPRVLVMGLGGIGGIVSAHLLEQGVAVAPVTTNPEIHGALAKDGFVVRAEGEDRSVRGPAHLEVPEGPFDVVLLATQPPHVEAAAKSAAPALAKDGVMVCFQNGLVEERIASLVGPERVVGAIIAWGASMLGPGRYERTSGGGFTIGRMDGVRDERLSALALMLEHIGPVETTSNLRGARWSKLAINNAISTLGTVGGERLGALLAHRHIRRLALDVMTETVEVAQREDVKLKKVAGTLDLEWIALTEEEKRSTGSAALFTKHAMLLAVGARYRRLRSSMLSAIERGREPAVDYLNGEVVSRGEKHGVPTPVNSRLLRTVHALARGEERSSMDLLRRIYEETRPS